MTISLHLAQKLSVKQLPDANMNYNLITLPELSVYSHPEWRCVQVQYYPIAYTTSWQKFLLASSVDDHMHPLVHIPLTQQQKVSSD